jgi:hypothetical protein
MKKRRIQLKKKLIVLAAVLWCGGLSPFLIMAKNSTAPCTLSVMVIPESDTLFAGDSLKIQAVIIDDTSGVRTAEYETNISWAISPGDSFSWVAPVIGSRVTFHANVGYRTYNVIAMFIDPANPARLLIDTVKMLVRPGTPRRFYIEPYTATAAINPVPHPVDSIVLGDFPPEMDIYAVLRDPYGSFVGFDTTVTWEELGDSGIVKITPLGKTYVCRVEKVRQGTTYVLCKWDGSTVGTVKVIVHPGTRVVSQEIFSMIQKPRLTKEYFNLRGQKLEPGRINRTNAIIFERIILSDGSICIRKINPQSSVRYTRSGGVE